MIRRFFVPLSLNRKDAVAMAKRDLRDRFKNVTFIRSGKRDAALRWLEFDVTVKNSRTSNGELLGLQQEANDVLKDYDVKTDAEAGWAGWGIATGGLAVALAVALGADAALSGAIGVFVTASRGVSVVLAKVWGAIADKLDGMPKPPDEGGQSAVQLAVVVLLVLIFLIVTGWLTLPR